MSGKRHLGAVPGSPPATPGTAPEATTPVDQPPWLDDDAKAVWDRLAPVVPPGRLTPATAETFGLLCVALATYAEAHSLIQTTGLLIAEGQNLAPNPALPIRTQHDAVAAKYLRAFGLTPDQPQTSRPARGNGGIRRVNFT